ncbi:hypothetical protein DN748_05790 [Sinomicrobium soli]|nr:hypothetical protein DN748_05790 [Sinomicrobium sp. N-1-3-6]
MLQFSSFRVFFRLARQRTGRYGKHGMKIKDTYLNPIRDLRKEARRIPVFKENRSTGTSLYMVLNKEGKQFIKKTARKNCLLKRYG